MAEEAPPTLDGWTVLHDVRSLDRVTWNTLTPDEREEVVAEARDVLTSQLDVEDASAGASGLFSVLGGKGDLMLLHLRETPQELDALERALEATTLGDLTRTTLSYVSIVELGGYSGGDMFDEDTSLEDLSDQTRAWVQGRLHPDVPPMDYVSFYPMDKRRQGEDNWYTLPFEDRAALMSEHGKTGRTYAGRVKQIITGSMALDDWEWGVTVFSDDPSTLKEMVAEMRYDEVSARYGEFGPFVFGYALHPDDLRAFLDGEPVDPRPYTPDS